jgi:hypothetical protein
MQHHEFNKLFGGLKTSQLSDKDFTTLECSINPPKIVFPAPNKKVLNEKFFILKISIKDYMPALEFSVNLLPVLGSVTKTKIKAAVLYPRQTILINEERIKRLIKETGFRDDEILLQHKEKWSPPKIKKWLSQIIDEGINTLLLTEEVITWFMYDQDKNLFFKKSIELFEDTIKAFKLNVILAQSWSIGEECYHVYFSQMNSLFTMSIYDIIKFMISDFESCIVLSVFPVRGKYPRITLPPQKIYYPADNFPIKMDVRFPESSYKKIYSQIREPDTSFFHSLNLELLRKYTDDIMLNVTWPRG